jgi:hypothetical protein
VALHRAGLVACGEIAGDLISRKSNVPVKSTVSSKSLSVA